MLFLVSYQVSNNNCKADLVPAELSDYEEYYEKAEGPLIALYHDPDNVEALDRI